MTVTFAQHPSPDNKKRPHKDLCGSANLTAGITRFSAAVHKGLNHLPDDLLQETIEELR